MLVASVPNCQYISLCPLSITFFFLYITSISTINILNACIYYLFILSFSFMRIFFYGDIHHIQCFFIWQSCICLLFCIFFSMSSYTIISYTSCTVFFLVFSSTMIMYISFSWCLLLGVFLYSDLIYVFLSVSSS